MPKAAGAHMEGGSKKAFIKKKKEAIVAAVGLNYICYFRHLQLTPQTMCPSWAPVYLSGESSC